MMNKLISIFLLTAFLAAISCHKYELEVKMGDKDFKRQTANLAVVVLSEYKPVEFEWKEKNAIMPNSTHSYQVDFMYQVDNIKGVQFGWNLNRLPTVDSPHVYLKHVRVIPKYLPSESQRKELTKKFCLEKLDRKLIHDYYVRLYPCKIN